MSLINNVLSNVCFNKLFINEILRTKFKQKGLVYFYQSYKSMRSKGNCFLRMSSLL